MNLLSWLSIVALAVLLGPYLYWSWREGRASPAWVRASFFGGVGLFGVLFVAFTAHTISVIPERTHEQSMTIEVVAGKRAWQKYVCIDCHTLLGNGAYFAPELATAWKRFVERAGGDEKSARTALVTFLRNPPQPNAHRRGMTNFALTQQEATQLASFLEWISLIDTNGWPPEPSRPIRKPAALSSAAPEAGPGKDLFAGRGCTACHTIGGGPGVGPDLAGLASRYDRKTVLRWIQDPGSIYRERNKRPLNAGFAEMPAPAVTGPDAESITAFLLGPEKGGAQ